MKVVVVFIVVPKNTGLKKYKEEALSFLKLDSSKIIEVRGEDIPFWVKQFQNKGKKAIGLTGEDLYKEYCLEERDKLKVIKRIKWDDPEALFGKPTLCLIGPKDSDLTILPKVLTIGISSKYKKIAKKYLNFLERKGFRFKKIYISGSVETSYSEGIADLIIDIVYTGASLKKYGLNVYDKILQSDFLIIANGNFNEKINPKQAVQAMQKYDPPLEGRKGKLRLDFNENTIGCSDKVIKALKNISAEELSLYPEYTSFREKLANYLNVKSSEVILSNGTDEAIKIVMDTYLEKDDEIILPVPTFSMFKVYADIIGAKITPILYNDDLSFPTDKVLDNIKNAKLVVLVNPNNPTATAIKEGDIIKIIEKAKNSIVLIDEAYYQYYKKSSKELIKKYDNVIIIQTFSKVFGLAGLRLGYMISNNKIIKNLQKVISPYSVNSVALIAADAALDDLDFVENYAAEVNSNKKYIEEELNSLGIKTFPSEANFLIADFGDTCDGVCEELKKKDILVRNRTKFPLLKGCLRIGIGTREQCEKLINELKKIVKKAVLFDMDGVLADVNESYRLATKLTAEFFTSKEISFDEIQSLKEEGGFNNDWVVTKELIRRKGKEIDFETVKLKFQEFYLGKDYNGLIQNEPLVLSKEILERLSKSYKLGIMTGRPRNEANFFLEKNKITNLFDVIICKEDTNKKEKPDPFGINLALKKLGVKEAYYFGDCVDDMVAATKANIIPVGVIPPNIDYKDRLKNILTENNASIVIENINEVEEVVK